MAVVLAFGVSTPGPPRYFVFPNVCFFPSLSNFLEPADEAWAGNPIDALSSDVPGNHPSSRKVCVHKKMEHFYNGASPNHSAESDTIAPPRDATTNRYRRRFPPLHQG